MIFNTRVNGAIGVVGLLGVVWVVGKNGDLECCRLFNNL